MAFISLLVTAAAGVFGRLFFVGSVPSTFANHKLDPAIMLSDTIIIIIIIKQDVLRPPLASAVVGVGKNMLAFGIGNRHLLAPQSSVPMGSERGAGVGGLNWSDQRQTNKRFAEPTQLIGPTLLLARVEKSNPLSALHHLGT